MFQHDLDKMFFRRHIGHRGVLGTFHRSHRLRNSRPVRPDFRRLPNQHDRLSGGDSSDCGVSSGDFREKRTGREVHTHLGDLQQTLPGERPPPPTHHDLRAGAATQSRRAASRLGVHRLRQKGHLLPQFWLL